MTELLVIDLADIGYAIYLNKLRISAHCNDVQSSVGMQGHAEAEPAAKRRRIESAGAARPLSQQATQPLNAAPEASSSFTASMREGEGPACAGA